MTALGDWYPMSVICSDLFEDSRRPALPSPPTRYVGFIVLQRLFYVIVCDIIVQVVAVSSLSCYFIVWVPCAHLDAVRHMTSKTVLRDLLLDSSLCC